MPIFWNFWSFRGLGTHPNKHSLIHNIVFLFSFQLLWPFQSNVSILKVQKGIEFHHKENCLRKGGVDS